MPTQKDLKRLVRRRMKKTGESYTAARARLLESPQPLRRAPSAAPSVAAAKPAIRQASRAAARFASPLPGVTDPTQYAKIAGMSDAAVRRATGCDWKKWVDALDYAGAHTWAHRDIAKYLHEKHGVPDWWTQMVTVSYERIRGLRERGQRRGGGFEASKSRTFAVPVARLFAAFAEARARGRWLPGVKLTVRKATPPRSVRITWDDDTSVEVWLVARGAAKSTAQVQHTKLPDRESIARVKQYWGERLEALAGMLGE